MPYLTQEQREAAKKRLRNKRHNRLIKRDYKPGRVINRLTFYLDDLELGRLQAKLHEAKSFPGWLRRLINEALKESVVKACAEKGLLDMGNTEGKLINTDTHRYTARGVVIKGEDGRWRPQFQTWMGVMEESTDSDTFRRIEQEVKMPYRDALRLQVYSDKTGYSRSVLLRGIIRLIGQHPGEARMGRSGQLIYEHVPLKRILKGYRKGKLDREIDIEVEALWEEAYRQNRLRVQGQKAVEANKRREEREKRVAGVKEED